MPTPLCSTEFSRRLVHLYIDHVKKRYPDRANSADRLIKILRSYERHLERPAADTEVDLDHVEKLRNARNEAISLFQDIAMNEAERMTGWYNGLRPQNCVQRLANILAALIYEFGQSSQTVQQSVKSHLGPINIRSISMKEFSSRNARTGVTVPTRTELLWAEQNNVVLSGDLIQEIRAKARIQKRTAMAKPVAPTTTATASTDALTIKKLRNQVERLLKENSALKVRILTGT
jgi:hypothetical protein